MEQAKILIVDDDPDMTETTRLVLESQDYIVESAENSVEAADKLKSFRPDLIILDVMMNSSREGFIWSRELKKDDEYKDIPIVMLTAVKDVTGMDFKSAAGDGEWLPVEEFLDKPVKPEVLLEKVGELLANK